MYGYIHCLLTTCDDGPVHLPCSARGRAELRAGAAVVARAISYAISCRGARAPPTSSLASFTVCVRVRASASLSSQICGPTGSVTRPSTRPTRRRATMRSTAASTRGRACMSAADTVWSCFQFTHTRTKKGTPAKTYRVARALFSRWRLISEAIAWTQGQTRREREQETPWLHSTTKPKHPRTH